MDGQLERDVVANEMDQMQISQSEISLRAREIPEVDQSEISLRAREVPLFDQPTTAAVEGGMHEPKFDDSDDQHNQDSSKKNFVEKNEKNENSNFLGPEVVTCEPTCGV